MMIGVEFGGKMLSDAVALWEALNAVVPYSTLLVVGFGLFIAPRLVRWLRSTFGE